MRCRESRVHIDLITTEQVFSCSCPCLSFPDLLSSVWPEWPPRWVWDADRRLTGLVWTNSTWNIPSRKMDSLLLLKFLKSHLQSQEKFSQVTLSLRGFVRFFVSVRFLYYCNCDHRDSAAILRTPCSESSPAKQIMEPLFCSKYKEISCLLLFTIIFSMSTT